MRLCGGVGKVNGIDNSYISGNANESMVEREDGATEKARGYGMGLE